jgi:hypothetical protein
MKKSILFIALICQISIVAQNYKFGKVSKEEVEEKFYPLDSTADAAYLYKHRRTYYNYNNNSGFEIVTEVHIRIKLYTTEGFNYATFKLPYVSPEKGESENISSIKAYTYNINEKGNLDDDKLSNRDVFDEKVNKFRHVKTITMPNLKEGSVIELEYTLTSPYTDYVDDLQFQYGIPVKKLLVTIEIPEWLIFAKKNKGYYLISPQESSRNGSITYRNKVRTTTRQDGVAGTKGTTTNSSYENTVQNLAYNISKFEGENIPALKNNEPFVSNVNNYRGGVKYEIVGTRYPNSLPKSFSKSWDDVTKQIYKSNSFGAELEKTSYYKKDLDLLLADAKTDNEKLAKIFQYVKANLKWNGFYSKYTDEGVRKAYKEKTGNSAEINLILTSMLRSAGLNSNPVLVSSKGNGIPMFPTIKGFDYVISIVQFADDSYALLDATEPYSMPNILPERALNWDGRIVTKEGTSSWVKLSSSKHALEENVILVKITDDLMVEGMIRTKFENLNALRFRNGKNHLKEEELITKYEESNNLEIEDFKIANKERLDMPVIRTVKFSSEDLLEQINGKIYVAPLLFLTQDKNPFKLNERKFPVDFATAWKDVNRVSIQIPEGYGVESLPESLAIALPDDLGVFKYQVSQIGNQIKVFSILEFNSSMIPPNYYGYLKDFYSKLVKKETEKVVLVKK